MAEAKRGKNASSTTIFHSNIWHFVACFSSGAGLGCRKYCQQTIQISEISKVMISFFPGEHAL